MAGWPDDSALVTWMGATGSVISEAHLEILMEGVSDGLKDEAERHTGWKPLISNGTFEERVFNCPGPHTVTGPHATHGGGVVLKLDGPILELDDESPVRLEDLNGNTVKEFAEGTDFLLQPYNSPYATRLVFRRGLAGYDGRLVVPAKWGRFAADAVPMDIIQAVRQVAQARVYQARVIASVGSGLTGWKEGDTSESRDAKAAADALNLAESQFRGVLTGYMRIDIGVGL